MPSRHIDSGQSIYTFANHFLVRCPRCEACARVTRLANNSPGGDARLICTNCVLEKRRRQSSWTFSEPVDWFFHLPLWLQSPCCGRTLWAHNLPHLAFIEEHVAATHRVRIAASDAKRLSIRNATLASRLPAWMVSAKHREPVLKCLRRLRNEAALSKHPRD